MDAVKFIKEKMRMCNNIKDCKDCELYFNNNKMNTACAFFIDEYPEQTVAIVEEWSQEHPRKTMLQDFLEKHPKAKLAKNGIPHNICPDSLGYCRDIGCFLDEEDCIACWNRPLEE